MRKYIEIAKKLFEAEIIPFPGNSRPTNNMAVVHGGADVYGFPGKMPPMDQFTKVYIEAALWSSTDDAGDPLDRYDIEDIAMPTIHEMVEDCKNFQQENAQLLNDIYVNDNYSEERAGHDFWLTRNHHGVGYWDRGLGNIGKELTNAAHAYGEYDLYIGDDKMIHGG